MIELIKPTAAYKESFIQAVEEYQAIDAEDRRDIYELKTGELRADFDGYIAKLLAESKGENLKPGYVPQTTFWLMDSGEFIGRVSIRHHLTEHLLQEGGHIGYDIRPSKRKMGYGKKILALALPEAKKLGIEKVLVTCNEINIGSKKIIEANGGVLENKVELSDGKPAKLRYWIELYPMKFPTRAVAIVIRNNELLVMERRKEGKHYFAFPGGGVEEGETVEAAVVREVKEETTIDVEIGRLVYSLYYNHPYKHRSDQQFYLCSYIAGEPVLGESEEKESMKVSDNFYKPQWMNMEKLPLLHIYPLEIRDLLVEDYKNNFANTPREITMNIEDIRQ